MVHVLWILKNNQVQRTTGVKWYVSFNKFGTVIIWFPQGLHHIYE